MTAESFSTADLRRLSEMEVPSFDRRLAATLLAMQARIAALEVLREQGADDHQRINELEIREALREAPTSPAAPQICGAVNGDLMGYVCCRAQRHGGDHRYQWVSDPEPVTTAPAQCGVYYYHQTDSIGTLDRGHTGNHGGEPPAISFCPKCGSRYGHWGDCPDLPPPAPADRWTSIPAHHCHDCDNPIEANNMGSICTRCDKPVCGGCQPAHRCWAPV